ncbi:hypothetical protein DSO57_1037693 [Entomophthora muscae]|uniref:Uncharacterized protein n=2 Tax=Entomophthora muscae TaxID=34485 RepID=A0ACC2SBT3_9FUNG|nr:hypothetical protein DSO57_1037693 [Entomophthora muscae]
MFAALIALVLMISVRGRRMVAASCRQEGDSLQATAFSWDGEQGFTFEGYAMPLPSKDREEPFQRSDEVTIGIPDAMVNITTAESESQYYYAGPRMPMFQAYFKPTVRQINDAIIPRFVKLSDLLSQRGQRKYLFRFDDARIQMIFANYNQSLIKGTDLAINYKDDKLALYRGQLEMDVYDLVDKTWSKVNARGDFPPRGPCTTYTANTTMYLVPEASSSVFMLDLESLTWTRNTVTGLTGSSNGCLYLYDDILIHGLGTVGGQVANNTQFIDLENWALLPNQDAIPKSTQVISEPAALSIIFLSSSIAFIAIIMVIRHMIKYHFVF